MKVFYLFFSSILHKKTFILPLKEVLKLFQAFDNKIWVATDDTNVVYMSVFNCIRRTALLNGECIDIAVRSLSDI